MRLFLKIISFVFHPLLMSTYATGWLMTTPLFRFADSRYCLTAVIGTFLFTGIFPLIPILIKLFRGGITDIDVSVRQQRTLPYTFSFMAYVFWTYFLFHTLQMPLSIACFSISSAVITGIMMLINLRWKISAHLCCAGGVFAFIIGILWQMAMNPLGLIITMLVICALLGISRIELRAHTPAQALAGFLLGFWITLLPILLV